MCSESVLIHAEPGHGHLGLALQRIKLESQLFQLLSVSIHICKWVRERMEEEREQTMLGLF